MLDVKVRVYELYLSFLIYMGIMNTNLKYVHIILNR